MNDRYRVVLMSEARSQINQILQKSEGISRRRLERALRHIQEQLEAHPLEFGEPHYRLKDLGLVLCVGFWKNLGIEYGVHEAKRLVFKKRFFELNRG